MCLKSLLQGSFFIFLSLASFSCKNHYDANREFEEKFAKEVGLINSQRAQGQNNSAAKPNMPQIQVPEHSPFEDPATLLKIASPSKNSAHIDTAKIKVKQPQEFLPNEQVFDYGREFMAKTQLPKDMFIVRYATNPHPPFTSTGIEFDTIEIPPQDAFGVASSLAKKQYLLTGNNALQKNIDKIQARRTSEDIELSEIIISERKTLRKEQKNKEIFSDDKLTYQEAKEAEINEEQEKENKFLAEKRAKRNEPERQAIAAQIIQYNLSKNAPPKEGQ